MCCRNWRRRTKYESESWHPIGRFNGAQQTMKILIGDVRRSEWRARNVEESGTGFVVDSKQTRSGCNGAFFVQWLADTEAAQAKLAPHESVRLV